MIRNETKILVSIPNVEYYRNYITSPALKELKERCIFLVPEQLVDKDFVGVRKDRIIIYNYPPEKDILHHHLFNINMGKFATKNTSFAFRFLRLSSRHQKIYKILATPILYEIVKFIFLRKARDEKLVRVIKGLRPSIVLLPSSGYEGITFEIIKIAKEINIPTCMLVDNWDNLSSKTLFTYEPDYLVVWGQQAVEEAREIHGIDETRVFPIGTPRFAEYITAKRDKPESPYNFKYALFAGCALPFDELSALKKIDELIENNNYDLKIVYRPHPSRQKRKCLDNFIENEFKNVILDQQARDYYNIDKKSKLSGKVEPPNLNYYPKLLANMEFMICPLSTMLIEGLIFDKNVFILVYDDKIHYTNPKNCFLSRRHFKGIDKLKNTIMIYKFEDLNKIFLRPDIDLGKNLELSYFISEKTRNYPEELAMVVEKILGDKENVFRISTPYSLISNSNPNQLNKRKVIFFGSSFLKLSDQLRVEDYVKMTNACLDYIRRECVNYELYYKPHPAEKEELKLLNLTSFKILEDSTIAEIFIWKNLSNIAYSFSINSTASIAAYNFGLNSYVFYKLFKSVVGRATFEAWQDYFKNYPEKISIDNFNKSLEDNKEAPVISNLLQQNIKKLLSENNGKVWFTIVEPSPVMIMVAIAKLIKSISPERKIGLIISQQRRWRVINMDDFRDYFDEITFLPRVYYSLRPNKIWTAVIQAIKIRNLKVGAKDIIVSFMAFPNFSFVENCLISYFNKNKKITFCYPANFDLMYALKFSEFFKTVDFKTKPASLFFNKIIEPLLGLFMTVYLQNGDGKTFNITRYERSLEDIFDQVYLTQ